MSLVIRALDRLTNHVLVHTGQNYDYELNQVFFEDLGIRRPDHFLEAAGPNAAATIARVIERADAVFEQEQPDAVLIYGDTNSGLAVIPAKRRKIPIFHMEAGNRCFDPRVPEEINRKVSDHLSDVNLVLTEHARRYLLAEGPPAQRIFKVGSHMEEVLAEFRPKIEASDVLARLGLEPDRFFIVSAHREENVDSPARLRVFLEELGRLHAAFGLPIVVSTHPRTRARLEAVGDLALPDSVRFLPPFGFIDYVKLQTSAHCVLSDSGTIAEEAALLDLPAVTFRDAHERPEGMDAGTLIVAPLGKVSLVEAVRAVRDGIGEGRRFAGSVPDYQGGAVRWCGSSCPTSIRSTTPSGRSPARSEEPGFPRGPHGPSAGGRGSAPTPGEAAFYSAACGSPSPAIQAARSSRARSVSARFLSAAFSGPRRRLPVSLRGIRSSGGNSPKFTFIGWNERGVFASAASFAARWPPVMWPISAPSAVVGGRGASAPPSASATA